MAHRTKLKEKKAPKQSSKKNLSSRGEKKSNCQMANTQGTVSENFFPSRKKERKTEREKKRILFQRITRIPGEIFKNFHFSILPSIHAERTVCMREFARLAHSSTPFRSFVRALVPPSTFSSSFCPFFFIQNSRTADAAPSNRRVGAFDTGWWWRWCAVAVAIRNSN